MDEDVEELRRLNEKYKQDRDEALEMMRKYRSERDALKSTLSEINGHALLIIGAMQRIP